MRSRGKCTVGGVEFDCLSFDDILGTVARRRQRGERSQVALVNPHSVMMAKRDPDFACALAGADLVIADGVGISLASYLLLGRWIPRISGPDLMLRICERGQVHGLRHFFLGGEEGVPERLAAELMARFPGLAIAGTQSPPFRNQTAEEERRICQTVTSRQTDILWVGLGAPKQEKWIYRNRAFLDGITAIGVGAAFDFHSRNIPRAPLWMRRSGLEWLDRLLRDPRRMWRRNLDSPLFLLAVAAQKMRAWTHRADDKYRTGGGDVPTARDK